MNDIGRAPLELFPLVDALTSGPHGTLCLLVRYGSNRFGSDKDYLAVYDSPQPSYSVLLGGLDLWVTDKNGLFEYACLLDPAVSEPLLTGILVFGESLYFQKAKEALNRASPSVNTVPHLLSRSFRAYHSSSILVANREKHSCVVRRDYWSSLSFAISYWCFASEYASRWKGVLTLAELEIRMPSGIRELWRQVVRNKQRGAPIDNTVLDTWSRIIVKRESDLPLPE